MNCAKIPDPVRQSETIRNNVDKYLPAADFRASVLLNFASYCCTMGLIRKLSRFRVFITGAWESSKKSRVGQALRNKYIFTALLFFVWMLFFDQNNLAERGKSSKEYNQLLEEKEYYLKKIDEDRKRINELKTDADNLEKFAREQYLMKKDNEDIFIIVDE